MRVFNVLVVLITILISKSVLPTSKFRVSVSVIPSCPCLKQDIVRMVLGKRQPEELYQQDYKNCRVWYTFKDIFIQSFDELNSTYVNILHYDCEKYRRMFLTKDCTYLYDKSSRYEFTCAEPQYFSD